MREDQLRFTELHIRNFGNDYCPVSSQITFAGIGGAQILFTWKP